MNDIEKDYSIAQALLKKTGWKSVEEELPRSDEQVKWYDAMFDKIHTFSMKNPYWYDGDYTHWKSL